MEDRSPRFRIGQLASRTGVAPERLRKWEARYALLEPQRSAGGFRIYSLEDERRVRLMQRHLQRGYAAAEAAELAREGLVAPAPARLTPRLPEQVVGRSSASLQKALRDFDEGAAQRALDELFGAYTVEAVLRDAVLPFMRAVGDAWEQGRATPGQEHFATAIIEARLMSLTRGWGSGSGPRALLACPAGERHTLGLLAFGIVLSRRGWRITYLGADTPAESVAHAAERTHTSLIGIAASNARRLTAERQMFTSLGSRHRLCIGGPAATARLARQLQAEHLASDPVSAAFALAPEKRTGPQWRAGLKLGGWDSNPQPTD